jgi:hypothetical protein
MRLDRFTLLACLTALAACADSPAEPPPAPSGVQILAGDGQMQAAGIVARISPTVRVTDADAHPMRGIAVTFAASRNATVDPVVAITDRDGVASTTWILRTDGGEDTLLAKVDSLAPAVFHAASLVFTDISAGYRGTCGVVTGGRAFCWGANQFGQLGIGDTLDRLLPSPVAGGERYSQYLLGGAMSCGLSTGGQAFCSGRPVFPDNVNYGTVPVAEGGALRFDILRGSDFDIFCGLDRIATVRCWGTIVDPSRADTISGTLAQFYTLPGGPALDVSVETGSTGFPEPSEQACVTRTPGLIFCYDLWAFGGQRLQPLAPGSMQSWSAGIYGMCWIDSAAQVGCVSGNGSYTPMGLPRGSWAIDAGESRMCAATGVGVYCWYSGYVLSSPVLEQHTQGTDYRRLSIAADHSCAIDANSRAWCWGANEHGQLGDGTTDSSAVPRQVKLQF